LSTVDVEIDDTLAGLSSPSWTIVRDHVERAADLLRANTLDPDGVRSIGEELVRLVAHEKWEVRRAVASAAQHLRHETRLLVLSPLVEDENAYVQKAAQHALVRRTEATRMDVLSDEHDELLHGWLSELETRHGSQTMQMAARVASKYGSLLLKEALHEITKVITPLDLSLGRLATDLRSREVDRKACKKNLAGAHERLRLLGAMTKSLAQFTADVTPAFESENLRTLITKSIQLVKDGWNGRMPVDEIAVERGLYVDADGHRLIFAFSNIVTNAFEALAGAKSRGKVRIEARARANHAVISFTDNGCGMTSKALADAARLYASSKSAGRGFGLPFAKKVVETEHHGSLEIASAPDRGTTVTITLPLQQENA
jgi:signal transduction histidine kinase